ncbi:hypothetical protein, conserved [Trypanosoma brucei gambiense DAL972]|uniref:Uncharacterized protein n=2 Tax=Trypanosoma brucei TaxID=5691 RepID=D0A8G1_TRYB9|nr:hypothetical protein, conserved [Trypanosoma brucei gambiense DAL972]RHW68270.1 Snf7 [Trypanosoma brucei equiperdum]CBH17962.1 hypothetical protein, conserved [Trypanosoma brucei gambiense DAL972]|eukprot:XP_011780226.1 hypothetical protein, conserved [Trypanosoma brucei gambiense DAL972]
MFGRLFGFKSSQEAPRPGVSPGRPNSSLEELQSKLELLEKREGVLTKKVEDELAKAREFYSKKNKSMALQCMKRKKMAEDELTKIACQKQNLDTLIFTLQNQTMNMEVLAAQKRAKDELKLVNKKMDADGVDNTMDELLEEMDKVNAVSEALRQPLDAQVVDEDELLAELTEEMNEVGISQTTTATMAPAALLPSMPGVPQNDLPQHPNKAVDEEEEALRALERELLS